MLYFTVCMCLNKRSKHAMQTQLFYDLNNATSGVLMLQIRDRSEAIYSRRGVRVRRPPRAGERQPAEEAGLTT